MVVRIGAIVVVMIVVSRYCIYLILTSMMGFGQLAASLLFMMLVASEQIPTPISHSCRSSRCSLSPMLLLVLLARADLCQRAHLRSRALAVVSSLFMRRLELLILSGCWWG